MSILHFSSFENGTSVESYKMTFIPCCFRSISYLPLVLETLFNIIWKNINFLFLTDSDNALNLTTKIY